MDYQILVNKENLLDSDYVPENMVEINEPTGEKADPNYVNMLEKETYIAFKKMQKEALKDGLEIFVDSSYRSYDYQKNVYDRFVNEKGLEYAERYCAIPGSSEHQTGLAFDVISRRDGVLIEKSSDDDPEINWLKKNSYKFGFILRYPKDKENITGYNYERWHYRYVGEEVAKIMHDEGILTLEEYLSKYVKNKGIMKVHSF